jgi:GNAT superfamily N-acetyltransferase
LLVIGLDSVKINNVICIFIATMFLAICCKPRDYITNNWGSRDLFTKELNAVAKKTYKETYPDYYTDAEIDQYFHYGYFNITHNELYLVLLVKKQIAGYAKLIFKPNGVVTLDKLYLLRKFHGQGLGASLLHACYAESYTKGYSFLELMVWTKNIKALEFYRRNGLQTDGSLKNHINTDGSVSEEFNYLMIGDIGGILANEAEVCVFKLL